MSVVATPPTPPDHEVVDLDAEREKRGGAYQMPCPKCGSRMYVHGQRCPACGTWFEGPAFAYSSRKALFGSASRADRKARRAVVVLAVALGVLVLLLVIVVVAK